MLKRCLSLTVVAMFLFPAFGPGAPQSSSRAENDFFKLGLDKIFAASAAARLEKRFDRAYEEMRKALAIRPGDPIVLWTTARAALPAGDRESALALLEKLGRLKTGWNPAAEGSFEALNGDPRFAAAVKAGALPPVHKAIPAFTVVEDILITEGLAYDSRTQTLFLGNLYKKKIIGVRKNGSTYDFTKPGQDGLLRVLGMKADAETRRLWAASYAPAYDGADAGRAAVHVFDLETGTTAAEYFLPGRPQRHLLNDLVLVRGDAYITDTNTGALFKVDSKAGTIAEFLPAGTFLYPNGIAADAAGKKLFVACASAGIAIVDIASKAVSGLRYPPQAAPFEIDGLYFHRGSLIGVQNGIGNDRLIRFSLNAEEDEITGFDVLVSDNPGFEIPTTGALAGDDFYLIANSQVGREQNGKLLRPTEPVRILRIPLK